MSTPAEQHADTATTMHGVAVFRCAPTGPVLTTEQDATDLIGQSYQHRSTLFVLPVERLPAKFFQLRTGFAGQILQKFVGYHKRLVILGDISGYVARSPTLASLVHESNRGTDVWFLPDLAELDQRLRAASAS
jgi:hypothetical protein